jgi:hypothetical protein
MEMFWQIVVRLWVVFINLKYFFSQTPPDLLVDVMYKKFPAKQNGLKSHLTLTFFSQKIYQSLCDGKLRRFGAGKSLAILSKQVFYYTLDRSFTSASEPPIFRLKALNQKSPSAFASKLLLFFSSYLPLPEILRGQPVSRCHTYDVYGPTLAHVRTFSLYISFRDAFK